VINVPNSESSLKSGQSELMQVLPRSRNATEANLATVVIVSPRSSSLLPGKWILLASMIQAWLWAVNVAGPGAEATAHGLQT
jgi:hypothetical protein